MEFPNYIQAYFQPKVICLFVSLWLKFRSLASSSHKKSQSSSLAMQFLCSLVHLAITTKTTKFSQVQRLHTHSKTSGTGVVEKMKPVCVVVSPAVVMHPLYKLYLMWNIFEAMGAVQVIKGGINLFKSIARESGSLWITCRP